MEIKIGDTRIIDRLENVDFKSLQVMDQIITLRGTELELGDTNKYKQINDIETFFLSSKLLNCLYSFDKYETNFSIDMEPEEYDFNKHEYTSEIDESEYEDEDGNVINYPYSYYTDIESSNSYNKYLLIHDKPFKIKDYTIMGNLKHLHDDAKYVQECNLKFVINKLKNRQSLYNDIPHNGVSINNNDIIFYLMIPFNEGYILYMISHNIDANELYWKITDDVYFVSKDYDIIRLNCNEYKLLKCFSELDEYKYSYGLKNFIKEIWITVDYDIKNYIEDPSSIVKFCEPFKYYYEMSEIYKFFDIIYENKEIGFKGYLPSIHTYGFNSKNCKYSYDKELYNKRKVDSGNGELYDWRYKDKEIEKCCRITDNIVLYLKNLNNSFLNPKTGEIRKNDRYEIKQKYEDAESKILEKSSLDTKFGSKEELYYIKINDYYVKAYYEEINEINERIKVMEELTKEQK